MTITLSHDEISRILMEHIQKELGKETMVLLRYDYESSEITAEATPLEDCDMEGGDK